MVDPQVGAERCSISMFELQRQMRR